MAEWESAAMEMHFAMERLCQTVLANGDPTTIVRLRDWLANWTALSSALRESLPPEVAAA